MEAALEFHLKALETRLESLVALAGAGGEESPTGAKLALRRGASQELLRVKTHPNAKCDITAALPDIPEVGAGRLQC